MPKIRVNMEISRSLFHYALVHEEFTKSSDIVKGLLPLFSPVIAKNNGTIFYPEIFVEELERMYGLKMHPYVAEDIAPKLASENILRETVAGKKKSYINDCLDEYGPTKQQERLFKNLIDAFIGSTRRIICNTDIEVSDEAIGEGFLYRLARLDFQEDIHNKKIEKVISYSFARFIDEVELKGGELKELIEAAHAGAVIAEVILSLKNPPETKDDLSSTKILIDAPILIDAVGLTNSTLNKYTAKLLKGIEDSGGELITSDYYVKEAKELISNCLKGYGDSSKKLYLTKLDKFLLESNLNVTKAKSTLREFEDILQKKGIAISKLVSENSENLKSQRATGIEEGVLSALGDYQNIYAKERDAKSSALVAHMNQYNPIYRIGDARILFLTKNKRMADNISSYFKRKNIIDIGSISPVITDRKLATLLWVINGGEGENLIKSELLANCHSAVKSKVSVLKSIKNTLMEITSLNDEDRELFESVISNQRGAYCLLDNVGGDVDTLKDSDISSMLQKVVSDLAKEDVDEINIKLDKKSNEYEQKIKESERLLKRKEDTIDKGVEELKLKEIEYESRDLKKSAIFDVENEKNLSKVSNLEKEINDYKDNEKKRIEIQDEKNRARATIVKEARASAERNAKNSVAILKAIYVAILVLIAMNIPSLTNGINNEFIEIKEPLFNILKDVMLFFTLLFLSWRFPGWTIKPLSTPLYKQVIKFTLWFKRIDSE